MPDLISVIVPVYKVEAYLDACVQSIVDQTWRELEILLVDDGSPDRCGAMCDEWAKKDSRIRVIHKENGGLSSARNAGLDICRGDWVLFVDSDDTIHPQMADLLHRAAAARPGCRLAMCEFYHTSDFPRPTPPPVTPGPDAVRYLEGRELWDTFYDDQKNVQFIVAWNKLYRRELWNGVRYPVGRIHEDEFVTYRLIYQAQTIAWVRLPLYAYYRRPDSIMATESTKSLLDGLEALGQRAAFVREKLPDYTVTDYSTLTGMIERAEALCAGDKTSLRQIRKIGKQAFWASFSLLPADQKRGGAFKYTLPGLYAQYSQWKRHRKTSQAK